MILSLVTVPAFATDPVAVTGVTVNGNNTVDRGKTITLTATVAPDGATTKTVTWSSSDTAVATVANGVVTGVKAGTATITATSVSEPNVKGTLEVTVTDALLADDITSVTVNGRTYSRTASGLAVYLVSNETLTTATATTTGRGDKTITNVEKKVGEDKLTLTESGDLTCDIAYTTLGSTLTIAATPTTIVPGGTVALAATHTGSALTSYTWAYKVEDADDTTAVAISGTGKSVNWTPSGLTAGTTYTVTCTAKEDTATVATGSVDIAVVADTYTFTTSYSSSSAAYKLTKAGTLAQENYVGFVSSTVPNASLWSGLSGVTYTSHNTAVVTVDAYGTVTAVDDGTTYVTVSGKYLGKTYTQDVYFTVVSMSDTLDEVVNGDDDAYFTDDEIEAAAVTAVNKLATTAISASQITKIELVGSTLPASTKAKLYKDSYTTANLVTSSNNRDITGEDLYFISAAGYLGTVSFDADVTAGGNTYRVTFKVPVISDGTFTEEVEATEKTNGNWEYKVDFSNCEDLYIYTDNSFSNYEGYKSWTHKDDGNTVEVNKEKFNSNGECKFYVVSLDYYGVASTGTLTVTQTFNGIEYSGKIDEKIAFDENDFDEFIEDAAGITSKSKASVELVNVVFTKPSSSYVTLYDNGTKITDSKTKCTDLDKVYLTATKTGTYDISFTANAKYYSGSTVTTGTAKEYKGVVRVTVYKDGDITYEVDAGKTVTFNEDDFDKFYTKDTLSYVVFGTPSAGALYETSTCKTETKSTKFYFEATKSQDDLDTVTFKADKTPLTEYSVYIPFKAYAKNGTKSSDGVVEIIVNGSMPFTDVLESNTFYSYIKYCYRENIMQGKTATLFKPTEPVTRAQLVVTLYRMANSPTTYNNQPMSFTDCKTLGTEFQNAIKWGVAKKLINGYGNTFKPNDSITRQAMVTILYRFGVNLGYVDGYDLVGSLNSFSDAAKISASMKDAVAWAVGAGLVSGNNGKFNPAGTTTRGACAKILAGFHETYVG